MRIILIFFSDGNKTPSVEHDDRGVRRRGKMPTLHEMHAGNMYAKTGSWRTNHSGISVIMTRASRSRLRCSFVPGSRCHRQKWDQSIQTQVGAPQSQPVGEEEKKNTCGREDRQEKFIYSFFFMILISRGWRWGVAAPTTGKKPLHRAHAV